MVWQPQQQESRRRSALSGGRAAAAVCASAAGSTCTSTSIIAAIAAVVLSTAVIARIVRRFKAPDTVQAVIAEALASPPTHVCTQACCAESKGGRGIRRHSEHAHRTLCIRAYGQGTVRRGSLLRLAAAATVVDTLALVIARCAWSDDERFQTLPCSGTTPTRLQTTSSAHEIISLVACARASAHLWRVARLA